MIVKPGATIGIIGGGQLGRMISVAAALMGYKVHIFTDEKNSPASYVSAKTTVAKYTNKAALKRFALAVDVVTFEFENIPNESVKVLEDIVNVRPGWQSLYISQNRIREKDFLNSIGVATAEYQKITSAKTLSLAYKKLGPKCILKTAESGYDGKGQAFIDENSNLQKIWREGKFKSAVLEKLVPFVKEISVIVARREDGGAMPFIPVENLHKSGILDTTIAPARVSSEIMEDAWARAHKIADQLELIGLLCVEFFLTNKNELLVNEIAPRPHNSGHWTMDACITSQFEQLIRAICGLPLGSASYHSPAIMKNLIGDDIHKWEEFIQDSDTKIHIYGKNDARLGRKMGHVTHLLSGEDSVVEE
jgi:5-(carboxyamino)imidazole ribonucleotide synthase